MAWGAGARLRKVLQRMDAVAADPVATTQALMDAARLSVDSPVAAYERLAPARKTVLVPRDERRSDELFCRRRHRCLFTASLRCNG